MTRNKSNLGSWVLLGVGALVVLAVSGGLLKLALLFGVAYVFYKLFLAPEDPKPVRAQSTALALPPDPLDLHPIERAMDEERARLDRELERAIIASRAQQPQ